jgi:hypothetical protein
VLGQFIGEKQDFDKRVVGNCLAYGRDRGDANTEVSTDLFEDLIKSQNVDYVYIFDGDYWECYDIQYTLAINLYDQLDIEVNKK